MNIDQARRELVEAGMRLSKAGLVARSWGNLSLRLDDLTMAVTPSGIPYADLRENMIVVVDLATGKWSGEWKPTSERKVHRAIYLRRPEVKAVVHTHQSAASACAAARAFVNAPWGPVACAAYALPGTKAVTRAVVEALGSRTAVLMANHGVIAVGESMDATFDSILKLETACADRLASDFRGHAPGRADAAWDPRWLEAVKLGDGSDAFVSRAPFTLTWAAESGPKRAYLDDLAQLAGPRIPFLKEMLGRMGSSRAALVKGLGALVAGADAEATAMVVEKNARAAILGVALGKAFPIPAWEARLMNFVYDRSYSKQAAKVAAE
jgi:ribulose-5-phosphate 4-epimerase/fuculose-1-phosphate aldolase